MLLIGPLLSTAVRSLTAADAGFAFTLDNFAGLFAERNFLEAVRNTVLSGLGATLCSTILGFSLAWIVARTDIPGRHWFEVLNLVPFFLSPYVGAVSWLYLAAPNAGLIQNIAGRVSLAGRLPQHLLDRRRRLGAVAVLHALHLSAS